MLNLPDRSGAQAPSLIGIRNAAGQVVLRIPGRRQAREDLNAFDKARQPHPEPGG